MWSGGEDVNEEGDPVRLYQPMKYGAKPAADDLKCSFVGGETSVMSDPPLVCSSCRQPLHLLVQLYVPRFPRFRPTAASQGVAQPVDRTLQIFACNHAACIDGLFPSSEEAQGSKLCYGGGGVVVCRRLHPDSTSAGRLPSTSTQQTNDEPMLSRWVDASGADENEWGEGTDDWNVKGDMQDLETKLAAMETARKTAPSKSAPTASSRKASGASKSRCFPCLPLHSVQEPPRVVREGMDDDDVGISGSNEKIQEMLARYMAEEEDEDILAALRGTVAGISAGGGSGRGGERDERLSPEDRAFLTFSDRLKRSPRQVLRYAYGGEPLWSIPITTSEQQRQRRDQEKEKKNSRQQQQRSKLLGVEKPVPPCSACGASLVFELQLLPTLLHVLEVEKYSTSNKNGEKTDLSTAYELGGMNWGNIAIYSCPSACGVTERPDGPAEEYCVVQDSVDERPAQQPTQIVRGDVVVIDEGTTFDDDEDGDDEEEDKEIGEEDGEW